VAVSYLVYAGIRDTSVYYVSMDDFDARKGMLVGKRIRVSGQVEEGTVEWDAGKLELRFELGGFPDRGEGNAPEPLPVEFKGIVPDMFAEGRGVVVEGVYRPDNKFAAVTLLTKCPSRYEPKGPQS